MASALASQLQALAQQRQPALPSALKKGKPSLLFDFQKAADVDLQTIHGIACQGLEDLVRLEPRFRIYRETLFSRASLEINPELQTNEFLAQQDESITAFCFLLTNHFLAPAAFKALEYLIRRYKANVRNVDALMTAALPYHATNEFVRLVQVLALGAPGSLWGWLSKMQTSGAALPRHLLTQRCANDRQLLLFICKAAGYFGGAASSSRPSSRTFLSFYAVLLCEVLAAMPSVGEEILAALLPHLLEGLGRGAAQDYRAATLMVIAELCSRATLGRDFVKVLLNTMLKHTEPVPEHIRTAILVMAHVAVTQPHIRMLSDKTLKYLSALPNSVSELASLAQRGNIRLGPLLLLLVRSLAGVLASGGSAVRRCEADMLALAHAGVLRGDPARALAAALLEAGSSAKVEEEARASCQKVLRLLDQRYPETTDAAVNAFLEPLREQRRKAVAAAAAAASGSAADDKTKRKRRKTADGAASGSDDEDDGADATESAEQAAAGLSPEDRARFEYVCSTFSSGGYSAPCGGTMLTLAAALVAPQAAVRRMALQQLDADLVSAQLGSSSAAPAAETATEARSALTAAALTRLRDDDLGVVVAALGLACLRQLPPTALLDALQPLCYRLGEYLYGNAKLPQLKAARKAARKVVSLLRHVGSESEELRVSVAVQLAAFLLPSPRDPRVALEAARAVSSLGLPLFAGLAGAVPQLEAQLKSADKGKKAAAAGAVTLDRGILSALASTIADVPSAGAEEVTRLVQASNAAAGVTQEAAAVAASRRVHHLAVLASHAAVYAAVASAHAASGSPKLDKSVVLLRSIVQLSELLLSYARSTPDVADWLTSFSELSSPVDGLPSASHATAMLADAAGSHAAVVLGVLHASLARLPEASAVGSLHDSLARLPLTTDAQAIPASATRLLGLLAALGYPLQRLHDLPVLVTTRAIQASNRAAFLAGIYAAPSSSSTPPALQCLALHVQARLASAASAPRVGGAASPTRHASPPRFPSIDVGGWLVTLLVALSSANASVRSAACDCLAAVEALLESGKAAAGSHLSARAAGLLCSGLRAHRKLICSDAEALVVLLRGALHAAASGAAAGVVASPGPAGLASPSKSSKKKSGSGDAAAARLELSPTTGAEVTAYLTSTLQTLGVDEVGVNTAATALACLAASSDDAAPDVSQDLLSAASSYLSRCASELRNHPAAATGLHALVVRQLVRLFTPAAVATAVNGAGSEDHLGSLAAAAELLPQPSSSSSAASVAALAAVRLAAVGAISRDLFAALPSSGPSAALLFSVLLARSEGDPDESVRAAARASLEVIPLSAELIAPLVNPPVAAAGATQQLEPAATGRAKKKSKKGENAPAADAAPAAAPAASAPAPDTASLRDAVAALELLQWRTGISKPYLLVTACQALLQRLQPIVGSIASTLRAEDEVDADVDAVAVVDTEGDGSGAKSSLAGYAATLALQALTALAGDADVDMAADGGQQQSFDLELAVKTAREAPDAAVRNAALGLLASLAARMPEAALSHVLQVLAVVHQSAALQDDEHSRAVGATALAAVVPAWVAAGQRSAALWEQVVVALPSLPAHRRLDLLLALMRALPKVEEGLSEGLLVLLQNACEPKPQVTSPAAEPSSAGKASKSKSKKAAASPSDAVPTAAASAPAGPPPSEWLPDLASQLALQADLSTRLACCARLLELSLSASSRQPHTALPRIAVAFVTGQLKLKVALSAASVSLRRPESDPALEAACRGLMEAALAHMQLLQPDSTSDADAAAATPSSRLRLAVLAASRGLYGLFAALQGVMAADVYLQALLTLAEHPADKVKRRAIKLFTDKVRGVRSEIQDQIELPQRVRDAKLRQASEAATRACAMLPPLLSATTGTGAEEAAAASPLTRQLSLVALAAIASEFGAEQHTTLLAAVPAVLAATKDSHASIRASSLAAVAAFVRALGSRLVPVLPVTVAAAVAAADSAWTRLSRAGTAAAAEAAADAAEPANDVRDSDDDDDEDAAAAGKGSRRQGAPPSDQDDAALELSSALACLNALVETLGGFLSPHLPSVLAILLNPRVLACRVAGCDQFAASIRARLPTAVPARLLLPALYDRLQPCIDLAADAASPETAAAPAVALLLMVASCASALEAKLAAQYCDQMFVFLLRALDVRQRRPQALASHGETAIDAVEGAAIRALVALVMKLSEARFKPMFLRMIEWASTVSVPEGFGAGAEPSYFG
ncbi:hypothetical protein Agub_g9794, partial [Astrephomene gubernaculifera]